VDNSKSFILAFIGMTFKISLVFFLDTTGENITEQLIAEGLVEVRRGGLRTDEYVFL